jgi:flagellar basal body rod protein FlgG
VGRAWLDDPPSVARPRSSPPPRAAEATTVNISSLSGMQAASLLVDAIGHQVANVDTPGYDVDLATQTARLVQASIAYDANARVQQTQDEVTGAAIDVLA